MLRRYELTNQEWKQAASLLPPEKTGKPGRPPKDNRTNHVYGKLSITCVSMRFLMLTMQQGINLSVEYAVFNQRNLTCYWGNRDELTDKQKNY